MAIKLKLTIDIPDDGKVYDKLMSEIGTVQSYSINELVPLNTHICITNISSYKMEAFEPVSATIKGQSVQAVKMPDKPVSITINESAKKLECVEYICESCPTPCKLIVYDFDNFEPKTCVSVSDSNKRCGWELIKKPDVVDDKTKFKCGPGRGEGLDEDTLEVGDICTLSRSKRYMVVKEVQSIQEKITCMWFSNAGELQEYVFPLSALIKVHKD